MLSCGILELPPNIELIENIVAATNQSKGSVLAVLSELDVQLESGLKSGRIVHLPNGTHFEPIGKKDGCTGYLIHLPVFWNFKQEFCQTIYLFCPTGSG
jgi:hypothetical protein